MSFALFVSRNKKRPDELCPGSTLCSEFLRNIDEREVEVVDTTADTGQVDAVDWLLEDFALKYGVPVSYRKLTELLELVSWFVLSVPYLMRLKSTIQMVGANADSLTPEEVALFGALKEHIHTTLVRCFRVYKASFRHTEPDCFSVVKLATNLLKLTMAAEAAADSLAAAAAGARVARETEARAVRSAGTERARRKE